MPETEVTGETPRHPLITRHAACWMLRVVLYTLLGAALAELVVLEPRLRTTYHVSTEDLPVEWAQLVLLALSLALFVGVARLSKQAFPVAAGIACMTAAFLIRELDRSLDTFLFDGAWQTGVLLAVVVAAVLAFRHRRNLAASLDALLRHPASGFLLAAILTLVFSRVVGQKALWRLVAGDDFYPAKAAAEEGTELLSHFLLLVAALEWRLGTRQDKPSSS